MPPLKPTPTPPNGNGRKKLTEQPLTISAIVALLGIVGSICAYHLTTQKNAAEAAAAAVNAHQDRSITRAHQEIQQYVRAEELRLAVEHQNNRIGNVEKDVKVIKEDTKEIRRALLGRRRNGGR